MEEINPLSTPYFGSGTVSTSRRLETTRNMERCLFNHDVLKVMNMFNMNTSPYVCCLLGLDVCKIYVCVCVDRTSASLLIVAQRQHGQWRSSPLAPHRGQNDPAAAGGRLGSHAVTTFLCLWELAAVPEWHRGASFTAQHTLFHQVRANFGLIKNLRKAV